MVECKEGEQAGLDAPEKNDGDNSKCPLVVRVEEFWVGS